MCALYGMVELMLDWLTGFVDCSYFFCYFTVLDQIKSRDWQCATILEVICHDPSPDVYSKFLTIICGCPFFPVQSACVCGVPVQCRLMHNVTFGNFMFEFEVTWLVD